MKYFYLFSIVSLLFSKSVFSQGENNNWYFGNNAGVDFSLGSPTSLNGSSMNTGEGVASVSDNSGQLLFYTDGKRVWNKNHQIMPNGSSLTSSGRDASQGVVIVPYPNHPNEYFIFTTNGGIPGTGETQYNFMAYSKVDMQANNGLGDVVDLNVPLKDHNGSTVWQGKVEAITAINNSNENYWVVLPHRNKLLSYYIDENGVNTTPTQSDIVFVVSLVAQIKISKDHQFLAITEYSADKVTLYNFDQSTGQVTSSNPIGVFILEGPNETSLGIYSTEFTSNNEALWMSIYGASYKRLYGFDLNNLSNQPTLLQSTLSSFNTFGTLQRGIDDELYLASSDYNYLALINNSNNLNNASLSEQAIYLGGNLSRLGLPQLVPEYISLCDENLILSALEPNDNFIHEVSNNITTNSNYIVDDNQNITLSAGNSINILPNSLIKSGSTFLAKIEGCETSLQRKNTIKEDIVTQKIYINLNSENDKPDFTLYPNPSNSKVHISLMDNSMTIKNISINSMDEKTLMKFSNINKDYFEFDISTLRAGIYIVNVETKDNTILVKKLIVN